MLPGRFFATARAAWLGVLLLLGLAAPGRAWAQWDVIGIQLGAPVESVLSQLGTGSFQRFGRAGEPTVLRHETRGAIGRQYRLTAEVGGGEELIIVTTDNAGRIAAVVRAWRGESTDAFSIPTMIEAARRKFGPMLTEADATDSQGEVIVFRTTDGAVVPGVDAEDFLANRCQYPVRSFLWGGAVVEARIEVPARCGVGVWVHLVARRLVVPGGPGQRPTDSISNELMDFQALRRMIAGG